MYKSSGGGLVAHDVLGLQTIMAYRAGVGDTFAYGRPRLKAEPVALII